MQGCSTCVLPDYYSGHVNESNPKVKMEITGFGLDALPPFDMG